MLACHVVACQSKCDSCTFMAATLHHVYLFEVGKKWWIVGTLPDPYIRMPEVGMIRGALKLVLLIALTRGSM